MTEPTARSLADAVVTYYEELVGFAFRRVGSSGMATDIVQETWIRAATTGAAAPANPRSYLYRMVLNLLVDESRSHHAREHVAVDEAVLAAVASQAPGPDRIAADREEVAILADAVRELPDKCRQVFLLYRGRGLTMREIAGRLGIAEKTVEKHIARAMLHCRQRLRAAGRDI